MLSFGWVFPLEISALEWDVVSVICTLLVGELCVACGRLASVVGLWWTRDRCGAHIVWVGVFSLCAEVI